MKRARIATPHNIEWVEDNTTHTPQAGEVKIKPVAVGVCGSDIHVFEGLHPFVSLPVYPGHEVAGRVTELGPGTDPTWQDAMVVLEPNVTCGQCRACKEGRYNICEKLAVMGFQTPGAMSQEFIAPTHRLHKLPKNISAETGAMIEPLAVAVHAVKLADVQNKKVAVLGAGTIGLLVAQVTRAYGAKEVEVYDLVESRKKIANTLGFKIGEDFAAGYDTIFECVGNGGALSSAIERARKGATIVVVGVYGKPATIPAALIQDWELVLKGALMYTGQDYKDAITLLTENKINVAALITHRFQLPEVKAAFEQALQRETALKVMLLAD